MMAALTDLESLLKREMGLDAASIGSSAIEGAVRARLAVCRLADIDAYRDLVSTSAQELQALIEAIVIPETWFFRDAEAFDALTRIACDDWLPRHDAGVLRLLSLPCSSGEEPYSMLMALVDGGFPRARLRIDALDISQRAIAAARAGLYGRNSFRGKDLAFRERHFSCDGDACRIDVSLRDAVHFRHANLFDADFSARLGSYDVIFCRNILIYFDADTQRHALDVLARLLAPDGALIVAPAETGLLLSHDFRMLRRAGACYFHKGRAVRGAARQNAPATLSPAKSAATASRPSPSTIAAKIAPVAQPRPPLPADVPAPQDFVDLFRVQVDREIEGQA